MISRTRDRDILHVEQRRPLMDALEYRIAGPAPAYRNQKPPRREHDLLG